MNHFSLADLEAFDPYAPGRYKQERRFWCPECGDAHTKDRAHRSFALNTETGAWFCHRCSAKGLLKDFRSDAPKPSPKACARAAVARVFSMRPMMDDLVSSETPTAVRGREWWDRSTGSDEPRCAEYLESRGVPDVVASQAGVRFSSEWYGRPAVLFPVRDRAGNLIAVCGRFTDGRTDPKTQSAGPKGQGVFATPGALSADVIAVVEGPMDALALWLCGVASVALIGTSWPEWLPQALAFKNVLIATDADDAGNTAANKMKVELEARGAKTFRLRPRIGKDWNESLQLLGAETLRAHLAPFSETADDEMRVNAAWEFDKNGRQGLSGFVASLIKDGMTRETLLMRLRRADVPEAVYGAVETTPVVTFGGDYQRGNPDALLWRFASEHPTVKAMASVFGGLEIIGVQQVSMEVQRAA